MKRINESHRSSSVDRQRGSFRALNSGENAAKDAHSDDDEARFIGVRYITEDLIKKLTKQDNLALVLSLNLSSAHGDKYFRYIENLDKCDHLQVLNLSNNTIEKIEKLEKLHKLRELHLSNNRIRKIEGLEHMANLQILNLANNNIEQVPFWLAKKLRSLQKLNLQKNKIFSLHELSKLKVLKNLSELILGENPVSDLAHYRLFLVFHLRSLESLDGQLISEQERALAHQRFHAEEVERLEQELEERGTEMKRLQEEKAVALMELEQQEKLQQTLKQQCQEQQCRQEQLEMELDTKSELLKQKTSELTWACQKQYELEQELAFHKIDAKFEPLPYYPNNELQQEHVLSESPYIGKARHKRNMTTTDSVPPEDRRLTTLGLTHTDCQEEVESRRVLAEAEERLQQLCQETEHTERRLLRASEELQKLEEATAQKRISEAEKEHLRQQLQMRIQKLSELQQEAKTLERQLDRQNAEMSQTQGELDKLQSLLHTMEPEDPRHAHVKAQLASKSQLLAIMSRKQRELEGRLDDMLTRIAKETQEIKDLEQQLTDGQIAANEVLKKDLEDIISGLQEYLCEMKDQARRAQSDCLYLQRERDALQHLLQDKEQQLSQLREATQITERTQEKLLQHQEELQALRRENVSLRDAQDKHGTYKAKLESQLRERDTECDYLKEELGRLRRLSQLELSALQAELQKERQAKENALAQLQLAAERELENTELLQQLSTLQGEKGALMEEVSVLQDDLQQVRTELLCPKLVTRRLNELKRNIATGSGRLSRMNEEGDLLGNCLAELREELHCTVSAALKDRDEAQKAQDKLSRELSSLRYQLQNYEQKYKRAREAAVQARATERYEGEAELRQLKEDLQEAQDQQYLMLQRLQEAESERDHLLSELEEQDKQVKAEDTLTRKQVESLDLELQELRKSFTTADEMAVEQLNAAKDKIRSLHSTVHKISQERAEDVEELEESRIQAAQAMRDLKKAEQEIQVLQTLLQDRVHVLDEPPDSFGVPHSSINQPELARLKRALKRQQSQTRRLQVQLTHAIEDNNGNLEELIEEIEALRDTLLQQSNYLARFGHAPHNGGNWHYVPPYQNPASVDSQATQDSGLGSQHVTSNDRGLRYRGRQRKETGPSSSMGYWVYSPHPHEQPTYAGRDQRYRNSDGESDADGVRESQFTPPPGSVIYTMPPDGTHLPPGTVVYAPPVPGLVVNPGAVFYGPPPEGVRLVYGPPPSGLHIPLIPNGTLFCNVPGHLTMEHSLREAERSLKEQVSGKEVLEQELVKLEEQRSELQIQLKELRRAVGRLQRHRRLLESSVSSTEEESVMGEVKCAEKTLLRRRSELRESDRLLLEAEADLKETRAKTKDTLQRYNEVKRQLKEAERELEETERQTQDSAKQLAQTKQQYRDELQDLQRRKQNEETALQNIEKRIADRDTELQEVTRNLERASIKLENLQKELRETQCHEAKLLMSYRDSEEIVNQRRSELEHLNTQLHLAKEEQSLLGRKLDQWREEEGVMRTNMEKSRFGIVGVLRQGEEETHSLQKRIKELSVDMQDLSVQKGELDSQLSERKRKLALYKKEEQKEKETLQKLRSVISKHKEDLKRVLDRIQLDSGELEQVKYQHKQILDQLEKSQENLLQVRMDLQEVQRELEEQQRERERQRRLQEEELLTLKEQADAAAAQRSSLLEQCTNLEARRTQATRCLETAEEGERKAEASLLKLQDELTRLKQEHSHAQCLREELSRDTAVIQKQLQEKTEEMNKLKEQVSHSKLQLEEMRKEVEDARQKLYDLAKQQREQKAVFQDKIQRRQQRVDKLEQQLKQLEAAVARKQAQYKKEEDCLKTQQQQSLELEELQRQQQQKLQAQIQTVEEALAQRVEKMEQVTAAVEELEEKRSFLRADQKQCELLQDRVAQLEQDLAESEAKLWARTEEQRELRKELETCRSRIQLFQETLNTERCGTEVWRQGEEENRFGEIKESVCSLRAEVKAELDSGTKELEFRPADTESFEVDPPWNVGQSTYKNNDDQWRGDALREKLMQHEDHLKAQLRKTVFSQQEALSLRRQQTEGSIQGLRRRVDKLDQLLSKAGHDSPYLNDSELVTKYTASNAESWKHQRRGEHSFNAVRLDPSIPEKDQADLLSQVY